MIDPSGPLPPSVYWRRRMFAVGASVVCVVLLAWIIGMLVDGADQPPLQGASARTSQPPSSRTSAGPSSSASASATASGMPTTPSSAVPTQPPTQPPTTPPPPPQPCPDAAVKVFAETDQPAYRVGQRPLLRLMVVNAGPVACIRDVSRSLRELVITSGDGSKRLWSSNDCYSPPGVDERLMQPGERLTFTVKWAGRNSAPGCPAKRRNLPAGAYLVTGKLGQLTGPPVPLELTK